MTPNETLRLEHYKLLYDLAEPTENGRETIECMTCTLISILPKEQPLFHVLFLARGHHQSVRDYHWQGDEFSWRISTQHGVKSSRYSALYRRLAAIEEKHDQSCEEDNGSLFGPSDYVVALVSPSSGQSDNQFSPSQLPAQNSNGETVHLHGHGKIQLRICIDYKQASIRLSLKEVSSDKVLDSIMGRLEYLLVSGYIPFSTVYNLINRRHEDYFSIEGIEFAIFAE